MRPLDHAIRMHLQKLKDADAVAAALFSTYPSPECGAYHYRADGVSHEAIPFLQEVAAEFHARRTVDPLDRPVTLAGSGYRLVSLSPGNRPRHSPSIVAIVTASPQQLPVVMAALREAASACFGEYCDLKWK
ncbi:MAG: hypothetical protein IT449_15330 [Phycisphaerales bacterium]|nr:hypothetical protein [Phycisphaerales bacterium]